MITRAKDNILKQQTFFSEQAEDTLELIIDPHVNLKKYPILDAEQKHTEEGTLTIGDMHGNALKFIHFLIKQKILNISQDDYKEMVRIYKMSTSQLHECDLESFNFILKKSKINKHQKIRLLGDVLADRGSNDYFTLKILERVASPVDIEIIFSNHDCEFIEVYENGLNSFSSSLGEQARSLFNLGDLVRRNMVSTTEIESILTKYYFPNLKLISYGLCKNDNNIVIYSHAPIGYNSIRALAKEFEVIFFDKTAVDLAYTIEQINKNFLSVVNKKQLIKKSKLYDAISSKIDITNAPLSYPIVRAMWSRDYNFKQDAPLKSNHQYLLYYAHGHDGEGFVNSKYQDREINLDNLFGKEGQNRYKGEYCTLFSHEHRLQAKDRETKEIRHSERISMLAKK